MTTPVDTTEIYTAVRNVIVNANPGTNINWRQKVARPPTPANIRPPLLTVGSNTGNMDDALTGDGANLSYVSDEMSLLLIQSAKLGETDWSLPGQIYTLFQRATVVVRSQNVYIRARTLQLQPTDAPPGTVQHEILIALTAPVGVL